MRHTLTTLFTAFIVFSAAPTFAQTMATQEPGKSTFRLTADGHVLNPQIRVGSPQFDFERAEARSASRPKALIGLYASLAVVNGLDMVTTNRALKNGAMETNPAMRGSVGQQLLVKSVMSVGTVAVAEKLWKRNKVAAVVTMIATNGVMAAISASNARNARR
jgi:hypothetical protein